MRPLQGRVTSFVSKTLAETTRSVSKDHRRTSTMQAQHRRAALLNVWRDTGGGRNNALPPSWDPEHFDARKMRYKQAARAIADAAAATANAESATAAANAITIAASVAHAQQAPPGTPTPNDTAAGAMLAADAAARASQAASDAAAAARVLLDAEEEEEEEEEEYSDEDDPEEREVRDAGISISK